MCIWVLGHYWVADYVTILGLLNEGIEIVVPLEEGAPMGTSLLTNGQWVKNFIRRSLLLYEEVNKSYFLFQSM
jgi:hypothetical protein